MLKAIWWALKAERAARRAERAAHEAASMNAATKDWLVDAVEQLKARRPRGAGSEPIETVAQQARRQ